MWGASWETGKLILHERMPRSTVRRRIWARCCTQLEFRATVGARAEADADRRGAARRWSSAWSFYGLTRWAHDRLPRAAAQARWPSKRAARMTVAHAGCRRRFRRTMIIGIGSDLIDIRRIEKSLERYGERFIQRIFTEVEQAQVRRPQATAPPPMPSASPPRRPAPRRSAPAWRRACSGATWASSTCPAASRPCS